MYMTSAAVHHNGTHVPSCTQSKYVSDSHCQLDAYGTCNQCVPGYVLVKGTCQPVSCAQGWEERAACMVFCQVTNRAPVCLGSLVLRSPHVALYSVDAHTPSISCFLLQCKGGCKTCTSAFKCLSCFDGFGFSTMAEKCLPCWDLGCASCPGYTTCKQCQKGRYLGTDGICRNVSRFFALRFWQNRMFQK